MTVLKKARESLTSDQDMDMDACKKAADRHFIELKKTEKEWRTSEIGKRCNELRGAGGAATAAADHQPDRNTPSFLPSGEEMICERRYGRGRGAYDPKTKLKTIGLRCKPAAWVSNSYLKI